MTKRLTSKMLARFAALVLCACCGTVWSQLDTTEDRIRQWVEQLRERGELMLEGTSVAATQLIPELYERRGFKPAWTRPANIDALLRVIASMESEGLEPRDYHLAVLRQMIEQNSVSSVPDPALEASLDILLTDALVRLGYHVRYGKIDPEDLDPDLNFSRDVGGQDPADVVQAAIDSDSLEAFVQGKIPQVPYYRRLKEALAQYRAIQAGGGWPSIPAGRTLSRGMKDPRVRVLRERLGLSGDLKDPPSGRADVFDDALRKAVARFQLRHGLDADGVVGSRTLAALNVPVETRIDQIRANMERVRWVFRDIGDDYLVVDIAGFRVFMVRAGKVIWSSRAVVGKPYRKTPVFKSEMKYLVFNPTWTLPPTILDQDFLPKARRNPEYLRQKNIKVIDHSGAVVDPGTIDWRAYGGRNLPYTLRQDPGPDNALGRIKFMFPNRHSVYLHDTPQQNLFQKNQRAFSSGCIRIQKPYELAELLLAGKDGWNLEKIHRVIDAGKTKTVFLPVPMSILLLYWTVEVDEDGTVHFRNDLYDRDRKVLEALNGEAKFRAPDGMPEWYHAPGV